MRLTSNARRTCRMKLSRGVRRVLPFTPSLLQSTAVRHLVLKVLVGDYTSPGLTPRQLQWHPRGGLPLVALARGARVLALEIRANR